MPETNTPALAMRARAPEVAGSRAGAVPSLDPRWWVFAALTVATAVLYWPSVASLWARWDDPGYSHGWLLFLISGWLVWREARAGRLDAGRPSALGIAALPLAGLTWLLAMAGSIAAVQWLLLPALLFTAAYALFGWVAVRRLWFPLGFTLFAIPIWEPLRPLLQDMTTWVVGVALMALRIPALLDGYRVVLPAGSFEIVEGCSGMHFFLVTMPLASLYGWLWYRRLKPALTLLAVALAVAIVANWLRVFLVIYAGYLTDMQHYLVQEDHYYFGWIMYMLMIAPVFWFARHFEPAETRAAAPADVPVPAAPQTRSWLPAAGLVFAGLIFGPLAWAALSQADTRPAPAALPEGRAGWVLRNSGEPAWEPRYRGADAMLGGTYWRDSRDVDTWIVYYERPRQRRELANQTNRLAGREDGRLRVTGREAVLSNFGGERLIFYSHMVGGRESTRITQAKVDQIIGTLSGRPEAALIAISTPCQPDCDAARKVLQAFETDMGGPLKAAVAGQGGGEDEHEGGRE